MTKSEFLSSLRSGLEGLPQNDIEESITFYGEMIGDLVEEGLLEKEAVLKIGSVDTVVAHILEDIPLSKLVKEKISKKKDVSALLLLLIIFGSPVWVPLIISLFAIILSVYISLWSLIVLLWAVFASLVGSAFGGIVSGLGFVFSNFTLSGLSLIGAGTVCAGLSIFMFFGCNAATKGLVLLTKKLVLSIKGCFLKKEAV